MLKGLDVLVVLPTGYDKSIVYQSLPWLSVFTGKKQSPIVLVISPLVALMKNQVLVMSRKGIRAAYIGEGQTDLNIISMICAGIIPLVYSSPEAILSPKWRRTLTSKVWIERIIAVAIDEAHCIVEWLVILLL